MGGGLDNGPESWAEAPAGKVGRPYRLQVPLERPALQAALQLGRPQPHQRVLDVATGTAALLSALSTRPDRPSHAVGVDVSPEMLAAADPLPAGYELTVADARALPFPDGTFDLVFAAYLLHLLDADDRLRAAGEMARVLRPAGRAVTVTVWHPRPRIRRALARLPRRTGLRSHDPMPELEAADLCVVERGTVKRGYPSLVLAAGHRRAGPGVAGLPRSASDRGVDMGPASLPRQRPSKDWPRSAR